MNGRFTYYSQLIYASGEKNQDIHCNILTHMSTWENFISLSGKSQILEGDSYLTHG